MTINPSTLPSKFHPFLIGHAKCAFKGEEEIDQLSRSDQLKQIKNNVFDAGKWIVKGERADGLLMAPDTHIYRVRKAEKIRKFITENHLEEEFIVPQKYIYWSKELSKFYVISEKLELRDAVAEPADAEIEAFFKTCSVAGGQFLNLANGKQKITLSDSQARTLAQLAFLGYTDLTYNNMHFTKDGKIAIIDTEPLKRLFKKQLKTVLNQLFGERLSVVTQQAITGTAKLKLYSTDSAKKEIEKVETKNVIRAVAILVSKLAVAVLALYFAPSLIAVAPLGMVKPLAVFAVKTLCVARILTLFMHIFSVVTLWKLSDGTLEGVKKIANCELQGVI